HVHSPIRKHEMCVASVFFCAQVPAASLAVNILDLDRLSLQQGVNGEFRHGLAAASSDIAWTIGDAKNVSLAAIEPHRPVPIFSNWPHRVFFGNNFYQIDAHPCLSLASPSGTSEKCWNSLFGATSTRAGRASCWRDSGSLCAQACAREGRGCWACSEF